MNQAEMIIAKFGTGYKMAQMLTHTLGREIHRSTISRWTKPKSKGGTGGYIPPRWYGVIIVTAEQNGIQLSTEDFTLVNLDGTD